MQSSGYGRSGNPLVFNQDWTAKIREFKTGSADYFASVTFKTSRDPE